jgi:Taurine catabolism dioxygenase TauD, TfdA family
MKNSIFINDNILSADYNENGLFPVHINSIDDITQQQATEIIDNYNNYGFSIFQFNQQISNDDDLINFYQRLGLYQPYVPKIYHKDPKIYETSGLNHISKNYEEEEKENTFHRAFQTTKNQELHSDGTLEEIGQIKTSTLFCINPAVQGGENLIFNSVAAFFSLWKRFPDMASSMLDENALKRQDIGRTNRVSIGPAFKIESNRIISRFSMDNTCDWEYGFNKVNNLRECFEQLTCFMQLGSPYYIRVKLLQNQGLIMANHKISHGRTSYSDIYESQRKMIRGLYTVEPQLNGE